MPPHSLTRAETHARRGRIVAMRNDSVPFDEIARREDITPQRAHQIYSDALEAYPRQQVAEHRHQQGQLAERAVRSLLAIADDDRQWEDEDTGKVRHSVSPRTRVEAWNAVRGWGEYLTKLYGTAAPTRSQVDVVAYDGFAAQLAAMRAELAEEGPGTTVVDSDVIEHDDQPDDDGLEDAGAREQVTALAVRPDDAP